ncbi:hypothetical protein Q3G72_018641 [Acer saccharum]|nr:hypothetical protein Q3G72_018641 [Acer saccharum]
MDISLEDLSNILEEFAKARDWEKYTTVLGIYSLPWVANICRIDLADAATKKIVKKGASALTSNYCGGNGGEYEKENHLG